jgi:hypothetical protein
MNQKEIQKFKVQINDLMEQRYVKLNKLPYGSLVLFMDKKNEKLQCA